MFRKPKDFGLKRHWIFMLNQNQKGFTNSDFFRCERSICYQQQHGRQVAKQSSHKPQNWSEKRGVKIQIKDDDDDDEKEEKHSTSKLKMKNLHF